MDGAIFRACESYAATALLAIGLALALRGLLRCHAALPRPLSGDMEPLSWMQGFRLTVVGLCLAGIGAAGIWHLGWLLALSAIVGLEELLETSFAIGTMRAERHSASTAKP